MRHTIRTATQADADAIAEAHVDSIRTLGPNAYAAEIVDVWGAPRSGERYAAAMGRGEAFFVAVPSAKSDYVLGFSSHRFEGGYHRTAIYVRGTAIRQGIGTGLLQCAIDVALSQGAKEVRVDASLVAVPFYLRNGFVALETGSHRLQNGPEMPCVRMKKTLV
jgi:putative acetyltransferase